MSAISPMLNHLGLPNVESTLLRGLAPEVAAAIESLGELAGAAVDFSNKVNVAAQRFETLAASTTRHQCAPVTRPAMEDSAHPAGSLKADENSVTTAGGYRIEMLGQHEWKITGPDGKSTRVWGDPHVDENDGGKWDFKRNSTFMLGDGTRVNVTTVPFGNGMTVTGSLEIISGNDRVLVGDIDKGKGKIGTVTQDGLQRANSFSGDVFVMGRETDDWSFTGKEIIGSENGGDSFKLGGELHPLMEQVNRFGGGFNWARTVLSGLMNRWQDTWSSSNLGCNHYADRTESKGNNGRDNVRDHGRNHGRARWESGHKYDRREHIQEMQRAFRAVGGMFAALLLVSQLNEQISAGRFQQQFKA